jgi:hypothetical protein
LRFDHLEASPLQFNHAEALVFFGSIIPRRRFRPLIMRRCHFCGSIIPRRCFLWFDPHLKALSFVAQSCRGVVFVVQCFVICGSIIVEALLLCFDVAG